MQRPTSTVDVTIICSQLFDAQSVFYLCPITACFRHNKVDRLCLSVWFAGVCICTLSSWVNTSENYGFLLNSVLEASATSVKDMTDSVHVVWKTQQHSVFVSVLQTSWWKQEVIVQKRNLWPELQTENMNLLEEPPPPIHPTPTTYPIPDHSLWTIFNWTRTTLTVS